ncbi:MULTISPECIES: TIGR04086 family membrane protein [Heyndrickxia]|uniref:TIGR04086 family membrane protein n=1 Tax=Heyndrickxia faecalis TaxID=2824910 RepID=A0AAU7WDZ3_9BACI|nr:MULTISPECIES: TIGR04086 family membrane protein [Heyndrickxia]MED4922134.1 TIGR04086 family membrane protein [Weizmannia sp. CD-2023]
MKYLSDLSWWKQTATLVGGVLTALIAFFGALNVHFQWLTADSVNAFVSLIVAIGALFAGSIATILNTYLTNKKKEEATQVAISYAQNPTTEDAERERIKAIVEQVLAAQNAATTPSKEKNTATTDTPSK